MRAYSLDLRQRVITALEAGQSVAMVAERLSLSSRSVRRYRQQWRTQQTLEPQPRPGRHRKIPIDQEAMLLEQVEANPDATLREHRKQWHAQTGVWVSEATLCRALQRLQMTVKKAPCSQRPESRAAPGLVGAGCPGTS
jgi:transposase